MRASDFFTEIDPLLEPLFCDDPSPWVVLDRLKTFFLNWTGDKGLLGTISPNAYLVQPELIVACKGSIIEPGAYIQGPCFIGPGATIRHGAYIRGNVFISEGSVVGHDTEVKHAILLKKSQAAHFAYVGDSIIGAYVNLGAGVKCANLRFDHQPIRIQGETTGRRKLGAIIGDRAQVGCNAVLNPGTCLGPDSICAPLVNARGVVPAKAFVRNKEQAEIIFTSQE